jgi:hypothetical protein
MGGMGGMIDCMGAGVSSGVCDSAPQQRRVGVQA